MSIRCRLGYHAPSGWATKHGVFGAGTCRRCFQPVGGIAIDNRPPRRTQDPKPRSRIWWVRGIYQNDTKRA